jgi:RecJ-like exonuclease
MKLFIDDEVTRSLLKDIKKCADFIKEALAEGRKPIVRFHNDADGVVSAIFVTESMESFLAENKLDAQVRSFQTSSAIFTIEDAALEINNAGSNEKKPLMVLLDHGANPESVDNLRQLKKNGFKLAIVDHHPPAEETEDVADAFVTPFNHGGDSNYTAGLLSFEVARLIDPSVEGRKELIELSLEGDRSRFAASTEGKTTIALDYKTTYIDYPNALPLFKKFLQDAGEINEAYEQALKKVNDALEKAKAHTKIKQAENGSTVLVVKLKFKEGPYPSKGKIITMLKEKYCSENPGKPVVVLGYEKDKIIVRASKEAFERGFRANDVIRKLKEEFSDAIVSGGGHEVAAALQVKEELASAITRRFAELVACR